jgi:hypothetical protein
LDETEIIFKSSLEDQKLTDFQREVLGKCADIAKRVLGTSDIVSVRSSDNVAPSDQQEAGKEIRPRRNRARREQAIDGCILDYWYHSLIGEPKTQAKMEEKHEIGKGGLSKGAAGLLMAKMENCKAGAPKQTEIDESGKGVLYTYLRETLNVLKKQVKIETNGKKASKKNRRPE